MSDTYTKFRNEVMAGGADSPEAGNAEAGTVEGDTFESHSATLLPDGRVLIAGGLHGSYGDGPIATAMTWDPATGAFTPDSRPSRTAALILSALIRPWPSTKAKQPTASPLASFGSHACF